jgi:hypothetical protein
MEILLRHDKGGWNGGTCSMQEKRVKYFSPIISKEKLISDTKKILLK